MRVKNALILLLLFWSLASLKQQREQLAMWMALHQEVIQLHGQVAGSAHFDTALELTPLFSANGGWQNVAPVPQTSRQILQGRAVVTWQKAFWALSLATRYGPGHGVWQLQKWQLRGLDTDSECCELELIIAKEEGL